MYAASAAECRRELKKVRQRVEEGKPAKDAPDTVASWLARWRENSLAAGNLAPSTKSTYGTLSRKHLEGGKIGVKRLDRLRPSDVEAMIVELRQKLAPSSVRQCYTVLRSGLEVAVRDGLLGENPAAKVKRPKAPKTEARYLAAGDVVLLLEAAQGLRYHLAILLMAATGLRRGEVCALAWSDVDLDKGEFRVRHNLSRLEGRLILTPPKSERSRRRVPLHAGLVTELRAWRKQQLKERLAAGDQWTDTGMVFCTEFGTMVDPRNITRTVEIAAKKAGVGKATSHTMRHSAATAWLESGVHIKAVCDLLGHSSISITGDLYGHTSDNSARSAIDGLGAALGL
ncbi:site-specific integrase [Mycobacterium sp. 852013-51886_SCH5428379]|uniref:tyrosine-type recombinase/integrase n=1 Tax=Mycobacterium sp. 852013-51886_SCH5428379 TaxID=1834111 RepID=UPI001E5B95C9|nr:site-specific integrase [Mycobacterium sp. 852013-51886_SCH5428379]